MRIESVEVYVCFAGWRNWVFVEILTDEGLIGTGEATLEGRELAVEGAINDLARSVVGRDPTQIGRLSYEVTRDGFWTAGPVQLTALSGIEQACWDILGQQVGLPVDALLGGAIRDRVRAYANGWYFGATDPEDIAERAMGVTEAGYSALKWDPFGTAGPDISYSELNAAAECVQAVREAVGPSVELMIEGHGRFCIPAAVRIGRRLEEFDCYWFEEPTTPSDPVAIGVVGRSQAIPVVLGERLYTKAQYREILEDRIVSVIQPDVCHVGGILELMRIAAQADAYGISIAPHNPNGPVASAATLAIDVLAPNFIIQETIAPWDVDWRSEVVIGEPTLIDGHISRSTAPGLGVKLDHTALARHPYKSVDLHFFDRDSILRRDRS